VKRPRTPTGQWLGAGLALLALGVAACRFDGGTVVSPDPTPGPIRLQVAGAPVDPEKCSSATREGRLIIDDVTGLSIIERSGVVDAVTWPHGYTAGPTIDGAILYDAEGQLVAYTGDTVRFHVVDASANGSVLACGLVTIVAQPGN